MLVWWCIKRGLKKIPSRAIYIHEKYAQCPEKYKYHLITNNCVHFATFCVTGEMFAGSEICIVCFECIP